MSRAANTVLQQFPLHARGGEAYLLCSFIPTLQRGHHFRFRRMRLQARRNLWQMSSTPSCSSSLHKTLPADRTRQIICKLSSSSAPDWAMCFCHNRATGGLFLTARTPPWIEVVESWCVLGWRDSAIMMEPGMDRLRRLLPQRQCLSER
jgi:hypothetical protein